jgi:N-acetylneuraminate synthase
VGEVAQAHDGSLGAAHAFIDAIAEAGADAAKFQTHIPEAESTPEEKFRVRVFTQDRTRQEYWKRTGFSKAQWKELKSHCDQKGLLFFSSPFSEEAVDLLMEVGVPGWKVGAGETNNLPLIRRMVDTGLPLFLSTGMSYLAEVDRVVELVKAAGLPLLVYQCTSRYPCPPEHVGLNLIREFAERYDVPIGFSDHSGRACTAFAAHAYGACSIEIHVAFSRRCFGPDVAASLSPEELAGVVEGIRFLERARSCPQGKDAEARALESARALFTKSVVPREDVPAGAEMTAERLACRKPGTGIPAAKYDSVLGKRAAHALKANQLIGWEDLVDE